MKKILFITFILLMGLVSAADFTPQGNINLRDTYNITGAPYINATLYYGNLSQMTGAVSSSNSTTWWASVSGWVSGWFIQTGNDLDFNETKLNETIKAIDTATNTSMKTYVDGVNTSQTSWTDSLFVRFTELVSQIGNWTADKTDYYTHPTIDGFNLSHWTDDLGNRGYTSNLNFTNDAGYYNSADFSIGDYSTTAEIIAFGYYNSTDFVITDYFTKAQIENFGYYNSSDFSIVDYFTSAEILAFNYYNSSDFDIADYVTSVILAGYNYYNSTDFDINDYYTKANIEGFNYYNSTDFDINDYATDIKVDSLGNFSAWDKDYNDLINTPTFTNDTWVDTYFPRFTEIVGLVGNWTADKGDYWDATTDLDGVIATDEITELKIDFNTVCGAGSHLYVSGNNLACETDDDTTYSAGANLSLDGTTFSLDATSVKSWLDGIYAALADANPFGSDIEDTEMAAEDFGEFTCTGNEDGCTLNSGVYDDEYIELGDSFIGDVTGTYGATVVGDNTHNHTYTTITPMTEANLYTILSDVSQFYEAGDKVGDADTLDTHDTSYFQSALVNETGLYAALSDVTDFLQSLVQDTSPQLGGYLDTAGQNIGSTADEIENVYVATNSRIYFGDGQEASIYYNGTVLIIG